ncbi:MAG TPA: hypothetical protein V6D09_19930 [Leptolyngbyaceae cyanobacterium]
MRSPASDTGCTTKIMVLQTDPATSAQACIDRQIVCSDLRATNSPPRKTCQHKERPQIATRSLVLRQFC